MFQNYGLATSEDSLKCRSKEEKDPTSQRKKKTKIEVVSSSKYESRSNTSSSSKQCKKGFKLSKQISKNIDKLYREDDWSKNTQIKGQTQKQYMLNFKLPNKSLLQKDSQLSLQKNTISTIQTAYHSSKSGRDSFQDNQSTKSSRSRGFMFPGQNKKIR